MGTADSGQSCRPSCYVVSGDECEIYSMQNARNVWSYESFGYSSCLNFGSSEVRVLRGLWRQHCNMWWRLYLGWETDSYEVFGAPSGTGCARSCENSCEMKLYSKGTDCRIRQTALRNSAENHLFHISLLTHFFTSLPFRTSPRSFPLLLHVQLISILPTLYRRDKKVPFDIQIV